MTSNIAVGPIFISVLESCPFCFPLARYNLRLMKKIDEYNIKSYKEIEVLSMYVIGN